MSNSGFPSVTGTCPGVPGERHEFTSYTREKLVSITSRQIKAPDPFAKKRVSREEDVLIPETDTAFRVARSFDHYQVSS